MFLQVLVGTLTFMATFWASVKLLDRHNHKNTWGTAAFIGAALATFGAMTGPLFLVLPLLVLLQLLVRYYDLGVLQSFGVVGSMFVMNVALAMVTLPLA